MALRLEVRGLTTATPGTILALGRRANNLHAAVSHTFAASYIRNHFGWTLDQHLVAPESVPKRSWSPSKAISDAAEFALSTLSTWLKDSLRLPLYLQRMVYTEWLFFCRRFSCLLSNPF